MVSENEKVVSMVGISKSFPGVQALSEVDFNLTLGEIHGLVGENGAGKSTLIKVLAGVLPQDKGKILVKGKERKIQNPRDALNLGIRVIHQELQVVPELSVAENVFLGQLPKKHGKISWKRLRKQTEQVLAKLDVELNPTQKAGTLDISHQQIVEIARAICIEADILVMDEPTAPLSDEEINRLFDLILNLKKAGVSVIYISHNLEELFEIADRVTILRDGRKIDTVKVSSTNRSELIQKMVGQDLEELYPKESCTKDKKLLEVKDLSSEKLEGISFGVHAGEVLGVYGLLGAGQDHLANALFGRDPTAKGDIYIKERSKDIESPSDAKEAGIGLVPSDRLHEGLVLELNVKDNIALANVSNYSRFGVMQVSTETEAVNSWKTQLGIKTPSLQALTSTLSGGNQQKVVLAKWLEVGAEILILNRPTQGVDIGAKAEMYNLIETLCEEGTGLILISQELPELLSISDRIIVLKEGKIAGILPTSSATKAKLLEMAQPTRKE